MTGWSVIQRQGTRGSLASCLESSRPIHLHNAPHLSHKNLILSFLGGVSSANRHSEVPHNSAVLVTVPVCCIYARKQQQEHRAQADRVGVQAGPLCERLFYIRNDISSQSIPFAWFSGNPLLADASRASSGRTFLFFRLSSSHMAASMMAEVFPLAPLRQVSSTGTVVGPVVETYFSFSLCQYENLKTVTKMSFPKDQSNES